ncbi:nucleoside 2-deoxyribosyltransferase [Candidatus Gottesmanbacteria bacterium]|nr:nucleoside 2-deoxyribosyltransferase [Candidatus Gottesmanbacteria bacterium]
MNVYFTASLVGKKDYQKNYIAIIEYLKSKGHTVQGDHILNTTENQVSLQTREERLTFHRKLEDWIQNCDCMIAETSFPSISVGYEVSLALQYHKPVLILYSIGDPPSLFAHHDDDKLVCEKYTFSNVRETIDDFINYVHGSADTRFTFFITPKIAAYLDKVAQMKKLPKSVYLRHLIEKDMK